MPDPVDMIATDPKTAPPRSTLATADAVATQTAHAQGMRT